MPLMMQPVELPRWAEVNGERLAHIQRVAALLAGWAEAMNVPADTRARWLRAAYVHDALRDAGPARLRELARLDWPVAILHGPAAANLAQQDGEDDPGVLDAIRYHSVGFRDWDETGKMLFMADYLEPGRDFDRDVRKALARKVPADPDEVLLEVTRRRMRWVLDSNWPLLPESVEFWNGLARNP